MIMSTSKNTFNSLSLEMKIQTSTLHNSKLSSFIALWLPKCDWQRPILGHGVYLNNTHPLKAYIC